MTLIFYKNEKLFPQYHDPAESYNSDLIEIQDKELAKQIKDDLNLNFDELEDANPIICGTVVNGGLSRKLKMIRADLFSMLSVCNSYHLVTNKKQSNAIKKGAVQFLRNI